MNALKRILLVDDNDSSRFISKRFLIKNNHNYQIVESNNGTEAIEKVQSEKFDLIIMDMCMPNVDGISAMRAIRTFPNGTGTPALMTTTSNMSDHHQAALAAGANSFIIKPFAQKDLINKIEELLSKEQ